MMNLYLLTRKGNTDYDEYDSYVVAAHSEVDARTMHPNGCCVWPSSWDRGWVGDPFEGVKVTDLGLALTSVKHGVICASFNAG